MTAPMTSSEPPPSRLGRHNAQERLIGMSRGDALAAVAGLLVFICSFLPQGSASGNGANMWHELGLVEVFAVPLLALAVVAFTLLPIQQTSYADADVLGVRPAAWRTVLSLVVAVASVFALFFWGRIASAYHGHIGFGAYLVLVFSLATAAGAILPTYVPDLRLPLSTPRAPQTETPVAESTVADSAVPPSAGTVSGQPPAEPGPGYEPAAELPTQSDPAPPIAVPEPADDEVRGPDPTQTFEPVVHADPDPADFEPAAPEPLSDEPAAAPLVAPTPLAPPMPFEPFWACFPTIRPLVDRANTSLTIGQVSPEEWYLVTGVDEHGASVSTSDGRSGLLLDTSGLIRADQ